MEENLKKINEAMPAADEEDQILMLNSIIESEEVCLTFLFFFRIYFLSFIIVNLTYQYIISH